MAPMSAPLLSTMLTAVALLVVALTSCAETWRPAPLLASADRPKFPFGGKRREPPPADEGFGLLDDVAGGRYGGGQAALPAMGPVGPGPEPTDPNAAPPRRPHADAPPAGAPEAAPHDDGISWTPMPGGEATLRTTPPPPLPGDPGWPREIGLLEAIANLPEQPAWDTASAARPVSAPAVPPLPLGTDPVPPFADLAPVQPWEQQASMPPPPPPPGWNAPAVARTAPPTDDPDSWHSWQWQTDAAGEEQPAPPPPPAFGTAASPPPPTRPSIWAAPVTPAADAWADAPGLPAAPVPPAPAAPSVWAAPAAPTADEWATAPAPSTPDALLTGWDTGMPADPPPPQVTSTWAWNDLSVDDEPAAWDTPTPTAAWDTPAPTAAWDTPTGSWDPSPPAIETGTPGTGPAWNTPAAWTAAPATTPTPEPAGAWMPADGSDADRLTPSFAFAALTSPADREPPAAPATDEWEALRGAFAGPEDTPEPIAVPPVEEPARTAADDPAPVLAAPAPEPAPEPEPEPEPAQKYRASDDPWVDDAAGYDPFGLGPRPIATPVAATGAPVAAGAGGPAAVHQATSPSPVAGPVDAPGPVAGHAAPAIVVPATAPAASAPAAPAPEASAPEQASTATFDEQFARGLQLRLTIPQSVQFLARGATHLVPEAGIQVLVASAGAAFDHDERSGPATHPGCRVPSPDLCPAIVQGESFRFADSDALDACPQLAERTGGPCAAVCIPLPALGPTGGVVHCTTELHEPLTTAEVRALEAATAQVAERLAVLRARVAPADQAKSAITGA